MFTRLYNLPNLIGAIRIFTIAGNRGDEWQIHILVALVCPYGPSVLHSHWWLLLLNQHKFQIVFPKATTKVNRAKTTLPSIKNYESDLTWCGDPVSSRSRALNSSRGRQSNLKIDHDVPLCSSLKSDSVVLCVCLCE